MNVFEKLVSGSALPVILDGANGTELQRLGARMDDGLWCARALSESPDIVRKVHARYIDAGADVVTTNSFSATREAMQRHGLASWFEEWNRVAVRLAVEARAEAGRADTVAVAGSVSTYGRFSSLDDDNMCSHFRAQGEILVDEGVDLLLLETLGSTLRTIRNMLSVTSDLGVPVWVSLSCVRDAGSGDLMFGLQESTLSPDEYDVFGGFTEAVREIDALGCAALLMMHSVRDVTEDAVRILRESCAGPVGAYPNAGYWTRPDWSFVDQVAPAQYLADARRWVAAGANIVGGCCGIGVEHIKVLSEGLKQTA